MGDENPGSEEPTEKKEGWTDKATKSLINGSFMLAKVLTRGKPLAFPIVFDAGFLKKSRDRDKLIFTF